MAPASRPGVFVDRDGVINAALVRDGKPYSPMSVDQLEILPGVAEACTRLRAAGLPVVVITNQPEVARGRLSWGQLNEINEFIRQRVQVDAIYCCTHDDDDRCSCRKPQPGLIFKASRELNIDPTASYCVGDRWRDVEAGIRAGCTTLLVDAGYAEPDLEPHKRVASLGEAADWIINRREERAVTASPDLHIKIFADGADLESIKKTAEDPAIKGFTTNPTLMRKAGVSDYEAFAKEVLACVPSLPVSFEVFSDEWAEMERQARLLASWGPNVYVKIPVTNTRGESAVPLIERLASDGIRLNVTALMTVAQVEGVAEAMSQADGGIISVFAGRIADSGVDPIPIMSDALKAMASTPQLELLWASPREVLNIVQADRIGCHIITATYDLLAKLKGLGKDLDQFSLETVQMFHKDAAAAGFAL